MRAADERGCRDRRAADMVDIPSARTQSGFSASPLRRVPPLHTAASRAVETDTEIAALSEPDLLDRIEALRADRNAVILAHYYQSDDIQDVADFIGDSLQLARQAAQTTDADLIVFCGVHFMAETAKILNPGKQVLLPDLEAGCSLSDSYPPTGSRSSSRASRPRGGDLRQQLGGGEGALGLLRDLVERLRRWSMRSRADQPILFAPDQFLGLYLQSVTGRRMHLWLGECHVHAAIGPADVDALFARHPDADLLLHPECGCVSQCLWRLAEGDLPADRTFVLSTGGMVAHARDCPRPRLVGTETGTLHRLRQVNPAKTFVPLREDAVCSYMKTITVPKLYRALRDDVYPVTVPATVARRARRAIDRMLSSV